MERFKLDLVALESSVAPQLHGTAAEIARNACEELASQLRPHVPGALDDEGLEALLGRLVAQGTTSADEPLADEADRAWSAHGAFVQPTAHGGAWRLGYVAGALRTGRTS